MALERRLKLVTTDTGMSEMNTALKVAFATSDMKRVDQHFGAAESFAVYALTSERAILAEAVQFGQLEMDGTEGKLAAKIDALDGCIAVYCRAVGASAIDRLRVKGIRAVKVSERAEIRDLIDALQEDLRTGTNTWLTRAVARREPGGTRRFDAMEQEGWIE